MDSTAIHSSSSKLPIKRKTPLDPDPTLLHPNESRLPPFKFHRIWTEPDEIRFLQGLVDSSSHNLAFPRDLGIFYSRFSTTMSQPYTKSQISEKLRRLRKKFRVISTRLSKGLDQSQLSPHDRALYDLSKQLWHPDFAAISPFNGSRDVGLDISSTNKNDDGTVKKNNLVGVRVDFSPNLPIIYPGINDQEEFDVNLGLECFDDENVDEDKRGDAFLGSENGEEVKLSEVNVKFEGEDAAMDNNGMLHCCKVGLGHVNFDREDTLGEVVVKVVLNVFDECCNDLRTMFLVGGSGQTRNMSYQSLQSRWQKQRIAELDVLGRRLRLVLEHSLGHLKYSL